MIYEFQITTDTTDTLANPKETPLKLTEGIIHQLDILSYLGSNGVLYLSLNHGGHQVFPINRSSFFRLGGEPFSFMERYNLKTEPFHLVAHTYLYHSTGVSYSHDVTIRIGLLRRDELTGVTILWDEGTEKGLAGI